MRKTVIALSFATALGGCTSGIGGGTTTIDPNIQAQVQQAAASICGFVPTIGTIASIIGTFSNVGPIVSIVNEVATSICNAVAPPPTTRMMLRRGTQPMVNGIPVQGYFLR